MMAILEAYSRVFVDPDKFDTTIAFYEQLTQGRCQTRGDYPQYHLQLATVHSPQANFLIIAGTPEARHAFEATSLTLKVDDLQAAIRTLDELGAEHLEPVQSTPLGIKTRYRHPDGLIVEYVEHQEEKLKKKQASAER
jgi:predicted enzyme related to lactoylglutathione lyase